jgi:hypothetical protein
MLKTLIPLTFRSNGKFCGKVGVVTLVLDKLGSIVLDCGWSSHLDLLPFYVA